ncbi:Protein rad9 like protein [Verticillium longisporum]|uniref:Sister chromatid cohesion protein n=1 Tax=Verticillium longisporum TaxID=100787 RepID=A0A8I3AUK7_VERLO|nr:Protein rad9 like protein [Verticillium longisporum]
MADNRSGQGPAQPGPANGTYGQPQPSFHEHSVRPFTLQEALPYSPQTSVVPFTADLIPDPTVGSGLPASSIAHLFSNKDFDQLNRQASQDPNSKQLKHAVDHLLQELRPNQRTFYKFKQITKPLIDPESSKHKTEGLTKGLTPLTNMVLERAPTFIRRPGDGPSRTTPNGEATVHDQQRPSKKSGSPQDAKRAISNAEAHRQNAARIEIAIPAKQFDPTAYVAYPDQPSPVDQGTATTAPQQVLPQGVVKLEPTGTSEVSSAQSTAAPVKRESETRNTAFAVELPHAKFNKAEYAQVPDETYEPLHFSVRREAYHDSQDALGASLDQRQRAETALLDLDRLARSVFDAVGHALQRDPGYAHIVTITNNGDPALASDAHQRLQKAVEKVISLGSYAEVPLDVLMRIQKLSEVSVKQTLELDLKLDDSWGESDVNRWLDQLQQVEIGLRAGRTMMRIMCGGREEKLLYSEDAIKQGIELYKNVIDGIVVPVVELKGSGPTSDLFKLLHPHKKELATILVNCQRLFALLTTLVRSIQLSDVALGTLEFSASSLIFVDNAHYEKDSVVGVQKFDGIRLVAMDMLCQIFLVKPDERNGIFNELLTSLEKLPVGKQSARQFRLSEGGNIQPLSALLMRLVQSSSGKIQIKEQRARPSEDADGEEDELQNGTTTHAGSDQQIFTIKSEIQAAELILRQLTYSMIRLWENDKSVAPAKNMALELLGVMCAAVSRLRSHIRKVAESKDSSTSDQLGRFLADLAMSALEQNNRVEHLVSWSGPFRATLEHLEERCADDPHLRGAISYLITDWAERCSLAYHSVEEDMEERDREYGRLAYRLRMMIDDPRWLSSEYTFKKVAPNHAKLSYSIVLLRSPFCELFPRMLNALLNAMASDQASVRSKSLRSINQLLETDPAILDGNSLVVELIMNCSNDSSPQVRDSAIGLMGKCIQLRSNLEEKMMGKIMHRFVDTGVGVRKRAMKLARDIYLRNKSKQARSAIAGNLLLRVQDPDESVRDLARQMIEEVWFAPFYHAEDTPAFKSSLTEHVALMIQTSKSGNITAILDKVLQSILGTTNKTHKGPFEVSIKLVASMFELIDNLDSDDPSIPHGRDALQVLQVFAKADPKLFTFEEIRILKPHLSSYSTVDDRAVFKAVTVIYRQVLPQLTIKHEEFLNDVRTQLQNCLGKIIKPLLDDSVACLWILAQLLGNRTNLARLAGSSLAGTVKLRQSPPNEKIVQLFIRYSQIIGAVGKHCDLDSDWDSFKAAGSPSLPDSKDKSVTKLMVDQLSPWADPKKPLEARKAALEAIGLICQSHPRNYVSPNVIPRFEAVFSEKNPVLEDAVLRSFKEFLISEERRSEASTAKPATGPDDKKRNLTVMGGTTHDDVSSATTQRFLEDITRIALSSKDEHAFLAVEVLGSINRQGLTHPKEVGVTLITLETCPVHRISEVAYMEHRALHEKYETVVEREYVKAIQVAYEYQRDIIQDPRGATENPFQSKLHLLMEVLKISKSKNRQKFMAKLVAHVDFDPNKLETTEEMPPQVGISRFIIENLAFFEYMTVGEVQLTVAAMEKVVSATGSNLAHVIETELFNRKRDKLRKVQSCKSSRLWRPLRSSMSLLSGCGSSEPAPSFYWRSGRRKAAAKDLSKTPVKVPGITGDKFWEEVTSHISGLDSQECLMRKCRAFVELMNVDKEFKVQNEDEELDDEEPATPSGGEDEAGTLNRKRKAGPGTPGSRKKQARMNGPKPRGRPRKGGQPTSDDEDADGDFDDLF